MGIGLLCIIFQLQVIKLIDSTHMATLNHQVKGEELHV